MYPDLCATPFCKRRPAAIRPHRSGRCRTPEMQFSHTPPDCSHSWCLGRPHALPRTRSPAFLCTETAVAPARRVQSRGHKIIKSAGFLSPSQSGEPSLVYSWPLFESEYGVRAFSQINAASPGWATPARRPVSSVSMCSLRTQGGVRLWSSLQIFVISFSSPVEVLSPI